MSEAPTQCPVKIRPLTSDDLPQVAELLTQRDHQPWNLASTRWFLDELNPERCRAWGAMDGDRLVGLTSFFLRTLDWQGSSHRVAYWANLYIDPAYRAQMLYPRLPMTMLRSLSEAGAEFVYAAVRLQNVAKAHRGLGFGEVGSQQVLLRLLRPGRFVSKYKQLPAAAGWAASTLDAIFCAGVALRGRLAGDAAVDDLAIDDAPLDAMATLINEAGGGRIAQVWTGELLRQRYHQTREGGQYRILVVGRANDLAAALVYRFAERGKGIQMAVVMDLTFAAGAERAATATIHRLESIALQATAEAVVVFDGMGDAMRRLYIRCGFRVSPEKYTFLVYPRKTLSEYAWLADVANWCYGFRDHDAF